MIRLLDRLSAAALFVGCLCTLLMMVHVTVDVVGRLVFKQVIGGTLEMVTYIYMVAIVFLPLAMVQRRRQQIIVEIFSQFLPPRTLALLDGSVGFVACIFMAFMAWCSGVEAWSQTLIHETAPSTANPVPIWPARWMVALGAALVAVLMALQSVADLGYAITGRRLAFNDRNDPAADSLQRLAEV